MARRRKSYPVAIVGMHGRFPDAYDVKDFWTNLYEGNDTVGLIPEDRWDWKKTFGSSVDGNISTTVNCAAFMPMVDRFDHRFFGIMPREAEAMDPQQRLFLQTAYAALEDAGYAPASLAGSNTGVFVGIGNADYPMRMRLDGAMFDIYRATGLALTCIANRVSFSLGIHGPSESIDTACSGSLVAIHRAIQSMQYGECDRAIVGGVSLLVGPDLFIAFDKAGMLSKSARSRTFDAAANGYVRGEGVAALVLRPLDAAEKNGDYIYGVIHGSAVNHGGRAHSFTAPNAAAQAQVIKTAWEASGKNFHEAFMIETHGTGTPLGDPIEVNGLKKAGEELGLDGKKSATSRIALGALKSHVGHMEATAGVGGLIKALLSMKYRVIPKNLNYAALNPHIDLNDTPFFIPTENVDLGDADLLAGVSSFGFGGVNSHVVVQSHDDSSADRQASAEETAVPYLIALSGKDKNSLQARVQQLIQFLEVSCDIDTGATYQSVMASLCASMGIVWGAGLPQPMTLIAIQASPLKWMRSLKALTPLLGRVVDFSEVRDCISLQEAARRIVRNTQVHRILRNPDQPSLCTRVALPEAEIRTVGLNRIAYSLMQGRDHFKERLACIAHSKEELLSRLRAYQESPEGKYEYIWTYSVRANDAVVDQPHIEVGHGSVEALSVWADWWVRTKSAALSWERLYPKAKKPRKFPLPAYPFQLDRIWYKAQAVDPTVQSVEEKAAIPASVIKGREPIVLLPSGIASAWEACMRQSDLIIPSSVMSLGYLLDYAQHKARGAQVVLKDVVFGRPCGISDEQLAFSHVPDQETSLIQCLASKTNSKILVQAAMANAAIKANLPNFAAATSLSPDQFLGQLARKHLLFGPVLYCINHIETDGAKLRLALHLPEWHAKNGRFWVPLMASMLAGLAYLNQQQNKPFQLPWKIRTAAFNPHNARLIRVLYIEGGNQPSVIAFDEAGNMALKLDGMVLRESAIVRLPLQRGAAESTAGLKAGAL